MAQQQEYKHDSVKLQYEQQKVVKVKISKKEGQSQKNLKFITNKIEKKWKLNKQYVLSIHDISIEPDDAEKLEKTLLTNPSPITINVIKKKEMKKPQNQLAQNKYITFIVHYDNNDKIRIAISSDLDNWDEDTFNDLINDIKEKFNIKLDILLCEDDDGEFEIDDIDGMKLLFEEVSDEQLTSGFTLDLYVKIDPVQKKHDEIDDEKDNEMSDQIENPLKIKGKNSGNTEIKRHRVYFLGPSGSHNASIHFPDISSKWYRMQEMSINNLAYLDVIIPWNANNGNVLQIGFKWRNKKNKWRNIIAKQELNINSTGFYCIETNQDVSVQQNADFAIVINAKQILGSGDLTKQSAKYILNHLIDNIKDWKSFNYSRYVLKDITPTLKSFNQKFIGSIFDQQIDSLSKHQMISVYRINLIKMVSTKASLQLNLDELYGIIECCLMDKRSMLTLQKDQRKKVMTSMYNVFHDDLERVFNTSNTKEIVRIYPLFNLFAYYQQIGDHKSNKKPLQFTYGKQDNFFLNDQRWKYLDLLSILKIDLKIDKVVQRKIPFEILAVRLCWLYYDNLDKKNRMNIFINIFKALSSHSKHSKRNLIELFSNKESTTSIFAMLGDRFKCWMQIIQCITPNFVYDEKKILTKFQDNLIGRIKNMCSNTEKLTQVSEIISRFSKLFDDTICARLALLSNDDLIKSKNELVIQENLHIIMMRVCKTPLISQEELQEKLIDFIFRFLSDKTTSKRPIFDSKFKEKRNIFLKNFMDNEYSEEVIKCFKKALKDLVSKKIKASDRIIMLMECDKFYELEIDTIRNQFIEQIIKGKHDKITEWEDNVEIVQGLIRQFAKENDIKGMDLWDRIFQEIIVLPKIGDGFINKLNYSLDSLKWVSFAMEMNYIESLNEFITFCQHQIKMLNSLITKQNITIKCIDLINNNVEDINKLVTDCGYKDIFKFDELKGMMDKFNEWKRCKASFDLFLMEYTLPNDAITKQTATIVEFLNDWNSKTFKNVTKMFGEWEIFKDHYKTLLFIGETPSKIFRNLWFSVRNDNEINDEEWTLNDYLNELYPNVRKEYDDIIRRIQENKLKIYDVKWFENIDDVDLELTALNFEEKTIETLQIDITDSLKITKPFCSFLVDLRKMVDICIENKIKIELINKIERLIFS